MVGIQVAALAKVFTRPDGGRRAALDGLHLEAAPGELVCLLGPSGCGKTTFLRILNGLEQADGGAVRFLAPRPPRIGHVFQDSRLLPWLTAEENVRFVLDLPREEGRRVARAWLARVGLGDHGGAFPHQLSAGMQQRVAVARALAVDPDVLLLDEPFSALDELTACRLRAELARLWEERRPTVLFVTHDPAEAIYLADRVVILAGPPGRIVQELDVRRSLPRPRTPVDPRLAALAREAVRALEGAGSF
ncbi:ABC transporter ATP-binding protein [Limnochorda pilosa]|uniref:ABC transporter domain-containing protein n=1 Tax=Limnochorda pilosa TaxID=1555112 RepID=A0A0K2SIM8_LIMPI|nr:ABC transporter ATP-binding protein [Limnochorda pilosa]BAS26986.1 hypothetical protein LIP_1129 [Limnochorda pilosa]